MRHRKKKIARMGQCPALWGTHGCYKQKGHLGQHYCSNRCPRLGHGAELDAYGWAIH